jgi:hypothetical protein
MECRYCGRKTDKEHCSKICEKLWKEENGEE